MLILHFAHSRFCRTEALMFVFCIAVSIYAHISCFDNFLENVLAFQRIKISTLVRKGKEVLLWIFMCFLFVLLMFQVLLLTLAGKAHQY